MEVKKEDITLGNFYSLIHIYNSKKTQFYRQELCYLINISENNTISFNKIYSILDNNNILIKKSGTYDYQLIIDRKRLAEFIRHSMFYKTVEDFIHKSLIGAVT